MGEALQLPSTFSNDQRTKLQKVMDACVVSSHRAPDGKAAELAAINTDHVTRGHGLTRLTPGFKEATLAHFRYFLLGLTENEFDKIKTEISIYLDPKDREGITLAALTQTNYLPHRLPI